MSEMLKLMTAIVKDLGFPIVVSLWLMWFVSRLIVVHEIVNALVRIDEKLERVLMRLAAGDDGS